MALPASGQLKVSDLRTEMDLSSVSNFSFSRAAAEVYVLLNSQSPSLPTANPFNNFNLTQWYSYCHKCASPCGPSEYFTRGYAVIDLGTTSGRVSYSGYAPDTWALYLGYPYNSSGTLVGTSIASGGVGSFSSIYDYTYSTERNLYFVAVHAFKLARIQVSCPEVNLYWSFGMGANSGTFVIYVNGSQVVSDTHGSSGNITVAFGDSIAVDVSSTADLGFTYADATTSIVEDSTQVCSDSQSGFPTAYSNCSHVAGFDDLEVYGQAAQV